MINTSSIAETTAGSIPYNTWSHVVATFDKDLSSNQVKIYINGVIKGNETRTTPMPTNSNPLLIGNRIAMDRTFNGKMDDIRIFNRALSPDEIKASYDAGSYRLFNNFTSLPAGVYNYMAYGQDLSGNVNQTETRSLTIISIQGAPYITSFNPVSAIVNDNTGASRSFNISLNQTVNVNWFINGTPIQSDASVTEAIYTTTSSLPGTWIVNSTATNANGTVSREWTWIVTSLPATSNGIFFIDPTPANGATLSQNYAFINTTVSNVSTAFIDWNRSLVGWWRFNGESGENTTFFRDWSSWGNNGACSASSCPTSTSGMFGNALDFDGSNDYLNDGNTGNFSDAITIMAWINPRTSGEGVFGRIVSKNDASGYTLAFTDSNGLYMTIASLPYANSPSNSIKYNTWNHIVATFDKNLSSNQVKIYINGVIKGNGTRTTPMPTNSNPLLIGNRIALDRTFNGRMDDIRIFNRALSPDEIKASYDAGSYRLFNNFTNLPAGVYNYMAYGQDLSGNVNQTETRTLTMI